MKKIFEQYKFFFILLGAGLLLRAVYLWEYSTFENFNIASGADVREYFDRATEIISGRIFPEKPDIHGIFYPLMISPWLALTKSVVFLRVLQMLLNFGAFAGLYFLLGKYGVPQKVRNIFWSIAALYPVLFFHSAELISETLLIPLTTVVMFMLFYAENKPEKRLLYTAFAGVFSAFAILTHGSMLIFSLLCGVDFLRKKLKKQALVFFAALIAVTGVFVACKSLHYGKFCFVQENGAFNFYLGNSEKADGTCRIRPGLEWRKLHREAEKEAEKKNISTGRLFLQKSLQFMLKNPLKAAWNFCRKAVMFFHCKELISGADPAGLLYRTYQVKAGALFTLFIMLTAVTGAAAAWKKRQNIPASFFILFISVLAVNILTVTSGRYRIAAYPSLFLFSACSIYLLPKKVTGIFFVISVLTGIFSVSTVTFDNESKRIIGEAAYRKGNFEKAYDLLSQISSSNDDPSGVGNMLGAICEKHGRTAEAAEYYKQVIKLEPERYEAYMNLAQITPQLREADMLFNEALKRGPDSGLLRVNYAKFLLRAGRMADAMKTAKEAVGLLPDAADAWNTLAVAYAYNGKLRLASEAFEGAAHIDPANENYRRNADIMKNELKKREQLFRQRRRNRHAPMRR